MLTRLPRLGNFHLNQHTFIRRIRCFGFLCLTRWLAVLTMQTVLLDLLQLVVETLFVWNEPPQPLLGILQTTTQTSHHSATLWSSG